MVAREAGDRDVVPRLDADAEVELGHADGEERGAGGVEGPGHGGRVGRHTTDVTRKAQRGSPKMAKVTATGSPGPLRGDELPLMASPRARETSRKASKAIVAEEGKPPTHDGKRRQDRPRR